MNSSLTSSNRQFDRINLIKQLILKERSDIIKSAEQGTANIAKQNA